MREQILIWYTPEEKMPEEGEILLFKTKEGCNTGYLWSEDEFMNYEGDFFHSKEVHEWTYL